MALAYLLPNNKSSQSKDPRQGSISGLVNESRSCGCGRDGRSSCFGSGPEEVLVPGAPLLDDRSLLTARVDLMNGAHLLGHVHALMGLVIGSKVVRIYLNKYEIK